ncbi:MAG TPA: hypothetical protein VKE69_01630, partial [Planctomycetota bacterium]|nr:hypothetical protein [Planctomycetota bacterium]
MADTSAGADKGSDTEKGVTDASGAPGGVASAVPPQETEPKTSGLQGASQQEKVLAERQQFLVNEYLKKGKEAYARLDYADARAFYSSALEVDPANAEAAEGLRRTQAALGEAGPARSQEFKESTDLQVVRTAEARQKVDQSILDGDRALAAGRYDEAINQYRTAERILNYFPLLAGERAQARMVSGKIDEALRRKEEAVRRDEETRRQQATQLRQERERQSREQLENQVRVLFEQANVEFLNERYAASEKLLDRVLELDPRNDRARELRAIAAQSRNERDDRDVRSTYKREWRNAFSELDRMGLPQSETIVHEDLEHWAEVSKRMPLQFQAGGEAVSPEDIAVKRVLDTTLFEPKFSARPIEEIAGYLQNLTQVNFVVTAKVRELDEQARSVTIELPSRKSVTVFLDTLKLVKPFAWRVEGGIVRIGTPEEMRGQTDVRSYEVTDLIQAIPDFQAEEITLEPSGGAQIPAGEEPEPAPVFTGDQIQQLITVNIAPASWQDAEAHATIRLTPQGQLVVRQTPEVHALIERFLNDLREATGTMVEVQTRFLLCEDNFLEDIGFDWRGLGDNGNSGVAPEGGLGTAPPFDDFGAAPLPGTPGQPGPLGTGNQPGFFSQSGSQPIIAKTENIFDLSLSGTNPLTGSGGLSMQWINLGDKESELILRAVQKSERSELVTAPRLLVHNGERSTLSVTNQFAYVSGYGVEIAQAASIADPQISIIQDGAVLDVRPVISADRKFVKLELRPTLASLRLPIEQRVVGVGNGTPVTIQ